LKKKKTPPHSAEFTRALATVRNTRGGLYRGFARLRLHSEPELLRRASAEFAKLPAYKLFTSKAPFPSKPAELAGSGFHYLGDFSREMAWLSGLFSAHAGTIARFVELRDQFERHYLLGDYSEAADVLDQVEQACGFSIWLVQRRMDLSTQMQGASARNRVLTETLGDGGPSSIHYTMAWFTYRSAAAVSRSEYERFLREASSSPRGSHLILYADAGIYLTIDASQAAAMLSHTDVMALVDRYQFALATAAILLGGGAAGALDARVIREHFCSLRGAIPDPLLNRLAFASGDPEASCLPHLFLLDLVDAYSTGKYEDIAADFRPQAYLECSIEALAIALRACICLGLESPPLDRWGIDPKSIQGRIATDLFEVLRFGPRGIDARLRLSKLILVHAPQQWTASLTLILERQQNDERVSPPNREQRIAALRTSCDHPIIAFCFGDEEIARRYLDLSRQFKPTSPTIASLLGVLNDTQNDVPRITADRSKHIEGLRLLRAGRNARAAEVLAELADDTSSALLRHEASLLLVACHLLSGDVASAADLAATLFVEERYFGIVLPVRALIAGLMEGHDLPLAESPTRGRISAAIVFDIYSRFVAADRDAERADAFNDVLRRYAVQKASELPRAVETTSEAELIYFLRYICIPEVLDQSLLLDTTKSVEDERLAILLALTEMPTAGGPALDA
jgi:hypothetical protein